MTRSWRKQGWNRLQCGVSLQEQRMNDEILEEARVEPIVMVMGRLEEARVEPIVMVMGRLE